MPFIQRQILPLIHQHLRQKEITLLLGPRQAGKTTLLLHLQNQLQHQNQPTLYFNLDNLEDQPLFTTQNTLVSHLQLQFGSQPTYVFIDEIQRLPNAGLFLKGLYDMNLPYKFIVTGSGSLELKANVIESMAGRKRLFSIYPLSFIEFVAYQAKINFHQVAQFCQLHPFKANRFLQDYITFGGYPRVVLASTFNEKVAHLKEIYTSYIEKDIKLLLDIDRDQVYQNLVTYLAAHTGSLINRADIARSFSTTEKTLKKYLYLLEKTFIITLIKPFFKNPTKELTKSPIAYFHDLGLRNLALSSFPSFTTRTDKGQLFQNFCFLRFLEIATPILKINYWRTQTGAEVDFVLQHGLTIIPVEAKAKTLKPEVIGKSLTSFIHHYHPPHAYLYHLGAPTSIKKSSTQIIHLPFYQLPQVPNN